MQASSKKGYGTWSFPGSYGESISPQSGRTASSSGWGGIECIFVAFLVLAGLAGYIAVTSGNPDPAFLNATLADPAAAESLAELSALTPLDIIPGLLERMMTIILHITWTLLVLMAVLGNRRVYLLAAIAYHSIVDVAAVYMVGTFGI